jgi:anthranilate phosphoribosyltransferase
VAEPLLRAVLDGKPGPHADIVILNAAAGLVATGVADELSEGCEKAREAIANGSALGSLERLIATSQRLAASPTA